MPAGINVFFQSNAYIRKNQIGSIRSTIPSSKMVSRLVLYHRFTLGVLYCVKFFFKVSMVKPESLLMTVSDGILGRTELEVKGIISHD